MSSLSQNFIDRSDALHQLKETEMKKLVILIGSDVVAYRVIRQVSECCKTKGIELHVGIPKDSANRRPCIPELKEYIRLERTLGYEVRLAEMVQLDERGDLKFYQILDVNSCSFRSWITNLAPLAVINLRGFQKFGRLTIDSLKRLRVPLLNLHPGLLPDYRGVFSTMRAMSAGEPQIGCTLHEIDVDYDTGPIHAFKAIAVCKSQSVLANLLRLERPAVDLIEDVMRSFAVGQSLGDGILQADRGRYFGFPTASDIHALQARGIQLTDHRADESSVCGTMKIEHVGKRDCCHDESPAFYGFE